MEIGLHGVVGLHVVTRVDMALPTEQEHAQIQHRIFLDHHAKEFQTSFNYVI